MSALASNRKAEILEEQDSFIFVNNLNFVILNTAIAFQPSKAFVTGCTCVLKEYTKTFS